MHRTKLQSNQMKTGLSTEKPLWGAETEGWGMKFSCQSVYLVRKHLIGLCRSQAHIHVHSHIQEQPYMCSHTRKKKKKKGAGEMAG